MFNRPRPILLLAFFLIFTAPSLTLGKGVHTPRLRLPVEETATYDLRWMGVPLGRATLVWQESPQGYRLGFKLSTTGVINLFSEQNLSALVNGVHREENGQIHYIPFSYIYRKQETDARTETRIRYDKRGSVYQLSVSPPDDPAYRPRVSRGGMNSAYDPLTALMALLGGETQFTLFDGRRLVQVNAQAVPLSQKRTAAGLTGYHVSRVALEGLTEKELKRMRDDRPVLVIMRPRESRFPERLEADTRIGSLQAIRVYGPPASR